MDNPIIAGRKPIEVELEAGKTYNWCRCGKSKKQPFCDCSHQGTSFTPLAFTADESGAAHLCMCKYTGNAPYCDGSHAQLPAQRDAQAQAPTPSGGPPKAMPTPEEPTVKAIHDLARDGP